jgi:hypothetical protein
MSRHLFNGIARAGNSVHNAPWDTTPENAWLLEQLPTAVVAFEGGRLAYWAFRQADASVATCLGWQGGQYHRADHQFSNHSVTLLAQILLAWD